MDNARGNGPEKPFTIAAPEVTLPKSGGAIRGIGEKFTANPVTGTGTLTVPIATTAGRSGFGPQLSLSYDSGSGNSPFGFGWRLSIPSITRKTEKGLPRYFDDEEADVFILSGAEDLVPKMVPQPTENVSALTENGWRRDSYPATFQGQAYTVQRYLPRIEGLFARIERWSKVSTGETFWKSVSKDNVSSLYGTDAASRIADPDDPSRVFSWLLVLSYGDRGNVILYQYKPEDRAGVFGALHEVNRQVTANRYLKRIQYGNRTPYVPGDNGGLPNDWCFEVVFDYGEHDASRPTPQEVSPWRCRPDPFSTYRSCFEIRTYRLCSRVLMFHQFPKELGGPDCLVRSTDLHYSSDRQPPDPLNPIYTFLASVTQTGYVRQADGNYLSRSLPPLEFSYIEAALDPTLHEADPASLENLPIGTDDTRYQWVDLDSEGSPGILSELAGSWYYKRNISSLPAADGTVAARFEPMERVATIPSQATLNHGEHQLMDLTGDGQLCVVQFARPLAGFYERDEDEEWQSFTPFALAPNIDWRDPNLRMVDLNGDGFADLLITEHEVLTWYPSLARTGFAPARKVRKPVDEDRGPTVIFADGTQSIYLADMSGDGLKDLVRIRNGEVCYWPNAGYGRFAAKIAMDQAPVFEAPDAFEQRRIRLADVDGSGTSDIIYLGRESVRVWFNQSGNGWGVAQEITEFPLTDDVDSVGAVDLLGNGTGCLVWSSPLPADAGRPLRYIELMSGGKPHLLIGISNNLGSQTAIQYAPSTKFYLADRAAGEPWVTHLSFPVQVVERIETLDWISRNRFITRYTYHHGYYDGIEREFRGFGRVDHLDTEELGVLNASGSFPNATNIDAASDVPPVLTKTWVHTGAYPIGRRVSRVYDHEYYTEADGVSGSRALSEAQIGAMRLSDTILPPGLSAEEIHEAVRSLKGAVLRTEIFALDSSEAAGRPYSVSERNYTIRLVQPLAGNRHAVFFTHPRESVDFHYERKLYAIGDNRLADPRVTHGVVLAVDDYGNELQSVTIGYGRRYPDPDQVLTDADRAKQAKTLLSYTENTYTNAIDTGAAYRTPLIAESKTYELIKVAPDATLPDITNLFTFDELAGTPEEPGKVQRAGDGRHDLPYEDIYASGAVEDHPYRRIVGNLRILYRKDDLTACLPLGTLASRALPCESYKLALTPGLLNGVYRGSVAGQPVQALSPAPSTVLEGTGESGGGYVDLDANGNLWIRSGQVRYSPGASDSAAAELAYAAQHFFLPCRFLDPFAQTTTVTYEYDLLVLGTKDAIGNQVTVGDRNADGTVTSGNDYRVMQPTLITDPNKNRIAAKFDALGLVAGSAVIGSLADNPVPGDSFAGFVADLQQIDIDAFVADPIGTSPGLLAQATTRILYDLEHFRQTREANPNDPTRWMPVFAATIARETHVSDLAGEASRLQIGFGYSDGFERQIQQKLLAEPERVNSGSAPPSPRWLASGWTIFNNKGKPVRQYEPFFSATHEFEFAVTTGVSPILFYDPPERVVATLRPNHAFEKVVFDPWRQQSWDGNDTVLISDASQDADVYIYFQRIPSSEYLPSWYTERINKPPTDPDHDAALKAAAHADTPGLAYFDALGRAFLTVADNAKDASGQRQQYATRTELDIQGYQRFVTDALGRKVMTYDYDMLAATLHSISVDAGERWMLNDVTGKPLFGWNSRGFCIRHAYDVLRRPTGMHVRLLNGTEALAENLVYGESQPSPEASNLRGKVFQSYDAAGIVTNTLYDFKGNLRSSTRQLVQQYDAVPDWSQTPGLETEAFVTSTTYDALNRPVALTTPDGSVLRPIYNQTKLLQKLDANLTGSTKTLITYIDYNAKNQRLSIEYSNGASTSYTYDRETFCLAELSTTRSTDNTLLQDLNYTYDPVGNITHIGDNAQQTIYFNNQKISPAAGYTYDPIYRLIQAIGRELIGLVAQPQTIWDDSPRMNQPLPTDGRAMRNYTEKYGYDPVGNILALVHSANNGNWTRNYSYDEPNPLPSNNRMTSTRVGSVTESYSYDLDGNMIQMPHLPQMNWTFKGELQSTQVQAVNNGPAETIYYVYNPAGQRTRKVTETVSGAKKNERIYLGCYEVYREYDTSAVPTLERHTVHVMDDKRRMAMVETKTIDTGAPAGTLPASVARYQFDNHLGSAVLELDDSAAIISYEEYYPYGSTSYQAVNATIEVSTKRYRYSAKERDQETGFYYHGARYYAPWLGRWTSCDPAEIADGCSLYVMVSGNPIRLIDRIGAAGEETQLVKPQMTEVFPKNAIPEFQVNVYNPDTGAWFGQRLDFAIPSQNEFMNTPVFLELKGKPMSSGAPSTQTAGQEVFHRLVKTKEGARARVTSVYSEEVGYTYGQEIVIREGQNFLIVDTKNLVDVKEGTAQVYGTRKPTAWRRTPEGQLERIPRIGEDEAIKGATPTPPEVAPSTKALGSSNVGARASSSAASEAETAALSKAAASAPVTETNSSLLSKIAPFAKSVGFSLLEAAAKYGTNKLAMFIATSGMETTEHEKTLLEMSFGVVPIGADVVIAADARVATEFLRPVAEDFDKQYPTPFDLYNKLYGRF